MSAVLANSNWCEDKKANGSIEHVESSILSIKL
jgi:hypothetical protein